MEANVNGSPGHLDPAIPSFQGDIMLDQVPAVNGEMLAVITFRAPGHKQSYPLSLESAKAIGQGLLDLAAAGKLTIARGGNGHV